VFVCIPLVLMHADCASLRIFDGTNLARAIRRESENCVRHPKTKNVF
jgi:hypothetical protein